MNLEQTEETQSNKSFLLLVVDFTNVTETNDMTRTIRCSKDSRT
jgi:hypothetical protein